MREKYASLSLGALKEIAKARGLKGISTLKKSELVERMVQADEEEKKKTEHTAESVQDKAETGRIEEVQQESRKPEERKYQREQREDNQENKPARAPMEQSELDSGLTVSGILEVLPDGYGFIRSDNYLPGDNDVYVSSLSPGK